jgi:LPS-assembly protein
MTLIFISNIPAISFSQQAPPASGANQSKNDKTAITWSDNEIYLQADSVISPEPGITVATGYVEIYFKDQHIQADKVTYNRNTGQITAEGNVTFQSEENTISCEKMEGITDGTAVFYNALIYAGDQIIHAEIIRREEDKVYTLESAVITPCTQVTPCWSLKVASGHFVPGEYVSMTSIFMRIMDIPVLYIPFFYLPLDSETGRTAGFLFPSFGSSSLYGSTITESFFLPISRSVDTTLSATYYSEKGLGLGLEGRYLFDAYSGGMINMTYIKETDSDDVRYAFNGTHRQDILGWKFVFNGRMTSDISYNQEYDNDISNITSISNNYLNASLSKTIGPVSLDFLTNYTEYIVSGQTTTVYSKLPSVGITVKQLKLFGSPVYLSLDADYSNLQKTLSSFESKYQRLDFQPMIGANFTGISWLTINPKLLYRFTNYTDSLSLSDNLLTGEPVTREYMQFDMKMTGPVFYKIYFTPDFGYADKLKHVIEPSISYSFISEPSNTDQIIYFDGIDYVLPVNEFKINLTNRLIANQRIGAGGFKTREFLTWQLTQYISLDPDIKTSYGSQYNRFINGEVTTLSPLVSAFTLKPTDWLSLTNKIEYDHYTNSIASTNIIFGLNTPEIVSNIQWTSTSDLEEGRVASNLLTASGKFRLLDHTFDIYYKFSYDIENDTLWQGSASLRYNHQCFSLILSYDSYNIGVRDEGKVSFNVELTGISGMLPEIMK